MDLITTSLIAEMEDDVNEDVADDVEMMWTALMT
jgi:hypothetical protein